MYNANRPTVAVKARFHVVPSSEGRWPRILCATDFSSRAEHAVTRAHMFAQQTDAQLLLLHVVNERLPLAAIGREAERARSLLEKQARLLSMDAPPPEISVRVGSPYATISRVAREWAADLVILGAHRERTGARLTGTIAERVTYAARCPVLVVNREPTRNYSRVLLASDLSDGFARVARTVQDLGVLDCASVSVVHALRPPAPLMLGSVGLGQGEISRYMKYAKDAASGELLEQLETAGVDAARFTVVQHYQAPFRAIEAAAESARAELVVVGTTRVAGLSRAVGRSVANAVLRKIACDILIVPRVMRRGRPKTAPEPCQVDVIAHAHERRTAAALVDGSKHSPRP